MALGARLLLVVLAVVVACCADTGDAWQQPNEDANVVQQLDTDGFRALLYAGSRRYVIQTVRQPDDMVADEDGNGAPFERGSIALRITDADTGAHVYQLHEGNPVADDDEWADDGAGNHAFVSDHADALRDAMRTSGADDMLADEGMDREYEHIHAALDHLEDAHGRDERGDSESDDEEEEDEEEDARTREHRGAYWRRLFGQFTETGRMPSEGGIVYELSAFVGNIVRSGSQRIVEGVVATMTRGRVTARAEHSCSRVVAWQRTPVRCKDGRVPESGAAVGVCEYTYRRLSTRDHCNHGRCPGRRGMRRYCRTRGDYAPRRATNTPTRWTCSTSYLPMCVRGMAGHNCNDDTAFQMDIVNRTTQPSPSRGHCTGHCSRTRPQCPTRDIGNGMPQYMRRDAPE